MHNLQDHLTLWVQDSEANLKNAYEYLAMQQSQAERMATSINEHSVAMLEMNRSFATKQENLKNNAVICVNNLRSEMQQNLARFNERTKLQTEKATTLLRAKADDIKKAVMMILKKLMQVWTLYTIHSYTHTLNTHNTRIHSYAHTLYTYTLYTIHYKLIHAYTIYYTHLHHLG